MSKAPKLQDTLEVFYKKLNDVEKELKNFKHTEASLSSKIEEFKAVKFNLNLEPLQEWSSGFEKNLANWRTELYSRFDASISHLDKINKNTVSMQENSRSQLEETYKNREKRLTNFYIYTTIAIIIALGGMYFGIKKSLEGSQLKSKNSTLEYHNSSMFEFINEKEQIEEFDAWLDRE